MNVFLKPCLPISDSCDSSIHSCSVTTVSVSVSVQLLHEKGMLDLPHLKEALAHFALDALRYFAKFESEPLRPYIIFQIYAFKTYAEKVRWGCRGGLYTCHQGERRVNAVRVVCCLRY